MAINFPNSPSSGDIHTVSGKQWQWDGEKWKAYGATLDPSVLKVDSTNNRVGINQTAPTVALDVTGSARITGDLTVSGTTVTVDSATVLVKDKLSFEGVTADSYETTLLATDPTADRTLTLPDATGTVAMTSDIPTVSGVYAPLAAPALTGAVTASGTLDVTGATTLNGGLLAPVSLNNQTGTTYTTVLADGGKVVECNNASATTVTVPPNSSVAYSTGTQIVLWQQGAGQVTVAAGAGVTIRSDGSKLKINSQYSAVTLWKRATDEWGLVGNLGS